MTDCEREKKSVKAEKRDRHEERERKRRFGVNAIISRRLFLSLSSCLSLFSAFTLFFSRSQSVIIIIFSLKMRVSSKELFSTLKNLE